MSQSVIRAVPPRTTTPCIEPVAVHLFIVSLQGTLTSTGSLPVKVEFSRRMSQVKGVEALVVTAYVAAATVEFRTMRLAPSAPFAGDSAAASVSICTFSTRRLAPLLTSSKACVTPAFWDALIVPPVMVSDAFAGTSAPALALSSVSTLPLRSSVPIRFIREASRAILPASTIFSHLPVFAIPMAFLKVSASVTAYTLIMLASFWKSIEPTVPNISTLPPFTVSVSIETPSGTIRVLPAVVASTAV